MRIVLGLVLASVSFASIACDAGDGRWTNCPDPHPGYQDPPCFHIWTASNRNPYTATCGSTHLDKWQFAQYFYELMLDDNRHRAYEYCSVHVRYNDGTWNVWSKTPTNPDVLQLDAWQEELFENEAATSPGNPPAICR